MSTIEWENSDGYENWIYSHQRTKSYLQIPHSALEAQYRIKGESTHCAVRSAFLRSKIETRDAFPTQNFSTVVQ